MGWDRINVLFLLEFMCSRYFTQPGSHEAEKSMSKFSQSTMRLLMAVEVTILQTTGPCFPKRSFRAAGFQKALFRVTSHLKESEDKSYRTPTDLSSLILTATTSPIAVTTSLVPNSQMICVLRPMSPSIYDLS